MHYPTLIILTWVTTTMIIVMGIIINIKMTVRKQVEDDEDV